LVFINDKFALMVFNINPNFIRKINLKRTTKEKII